MPLIAGPGDPGTTIVLDRLWLNLFADQSDVMSFRISSFSPGKTVNGTVRQLAGGRIRWSKTSGKPRRISATIVRPTAEQRAWLDEHAGELVIIRDPDGGKFVGVCPDLSIDRPVAGADLSIAFQGVTASEAV